MSRTITNPASSSPLSSSTMRTELQTLEDEVANVSTGHDHDGADSKLITLAADSVDTTQIKNNAVTADKLASNSVTAIKILDATITPAKMSATAWSTWVPVWTNLTVGNGVVVARYLRLGNLLFYVVRVTLGSTSSINGDVSCTLPVNALVSGSQYYRGYGIYVDAGVNVYEGETFIASTGGVSFYVNNVAYTYLQRDTLSATKPHTWANTDILAGGGWYEVA